MHFLDTSLRNSIWIMTGYNNIKLSFTGDILCYSSQNKKYRENRTDSYNFSPMFASIKDVLCKSDYVCGSLETPIAGKELKYTSSALSFNTPSAFLKTLKDVGVGILTTANNHCLDRGVEGLKRTICELDNINIDHTGTFLSPNEPHYFIKEINGVKFAYISYTYGTNSMSNGCILKDSLKYMVNLTRKQEETIKRPIAKRILLQLFNILIPKAIKHKIHPDVLSHTIIDCVNETEIASIDNKSYLDSMVKTIKEAKQNSDFTVFCLHSGGQFNNVVGKYTESIVKLLVENEVDAVICNHTHSVLQAKFYKNTFVAYSLGNFCFTPNEGYYINGVHADYSVLLNLNIQDKRIKNITFSILKSIVKDSGRTEVHLLNELYENETDVGLKEMLRKDCLSVLRRFCGKNISTSVRAEYDLQELLSLSE